LVSGNAAKFSSLAPGNWNESCFNLSTSNATATGQTPGILNLNIMLIESSQSNLEEMKDFLKFCGHSCTVAGSLQNATAIFEQNNQCFKAVITDYWDPGQEGGEVIKHLKSILPEMAIIAIGRCAPGADDSPNSDATKVTTLERPIDGRKLEHALSLIEKGQDSSRWRRSAG
jgi:DNA-binding NtrC family response regulator